MTPEAQQSLVKLKELESLKREKANFLIGHGNKLKKELNAIRTNNRLKEIDLQNQYRNALSANQKQVPLKPEKKERKSLLPTFKVKGLLFVISLTITIICIITIVSSLTQNQRIKDIKENSGEAYLQWCDTLMQKGSVDNMTEEEWAPVQKEWADRGVTVTWAQIVEYNEKNNFRPHAYSPENVSENIILKIFSEKEEVEKLAHKFGLGIFFAFIGIILTIVFIKGIIDIFNTLESIFMIPTKIKENSEARRYNQIEYPKLMKLYEEELEKQKQQEIKIEEYFDLKFRQLRNKENRELAHHREAHAKELKKNDQRIQDLYVDLKLAKHEQFLGFELTSAKINLLITYWEVNERNTIEEAVQDLYNSYHGTSTNNKDNSNDETDDYLDEDEDYYTDDFDSEDYSSTDFDYLQNSATYTQAYNYDASSNTSYLEELRRHNAEMERMENERLQMDRAQERRMERERQEARMREIDEERQRRSIQAQEEQHRKWEELQAQLKEREERRRNDSGLRRQCNSCKLASKCYMRGSFPCPTYRPQ